MAKSGTEYELFVKEVYESLNKADGLTDVEIQHDVKLEGAAGVEHQIDVFWSFRKGGIEYKVAVECKNYKARVSKEKIAAFHDILHDLGNVHGIVASKMGFQSGAIEYARKYGIQLMEIRHPVESDWKGKIKDIHVELVITALDDVHSKILVDKEKMKAMGITQDVVEGTYLSPINTVISFEAMIIAKDIIAENSSISIQEMLNMIQRQDSTPGEGKRCTITFKNGFFAHNGYDLPVTAIEFTYSVCASKEYVNIYGDEMIKAIVKNITENTESHINKFGQVR